MSEEELGFCGSALPALKRVLYEGSIRLQRGVRGRTRWRYIAKSPGPLFRTLLSYALLSSGKLIQGESRGDEPP